MSTAVGLKRDEEDLACRRADISHIKLQQQKLSGVRKDLFTAQITARSHPYPHKNML